MAQSGRTLPATCRSGRWLGASTVLLAAGFFAQAANAETKSFAVNWLYPAMYTQPENCPTGLNPLANEFFRQTLSAAGYPQDVIDKFVDGLFKTSSGGGGAADSRGKLIVERGRVDGKPVNAYINPESVPDPHYKTAVGHFAYGFNLDGKGESSPNGFEDPETHEKGVNNQLFRVVGCIQNHQALPPARPNYPSEVWETLRDTMPAWLVSITGADLSKDGDVTLTIDRALDHVTRDAGGGALADSTYRIDPDPRWHSVAHGTLKNGVVTVSPFNMSVQGDPFFVPEFNLRQTHIRLRLNKDGSAQGILGGYAKWLPLYVEYGAAGFIAESMRGIDTIGYYYALKKNADAAPDANGQNQEISTAWWLEAVPAFTVPSVEKAEKTAQAMTGTRTP